MCNSNDNLRLSKGRALWTGAEYKTLRAQAYKDAAAAAERVEELEIAERWKTVSVELETSAHNDFVEARKLGYFGPPAIPQVREEDK